LIRFFLFINFALCCNTLLVKDWIYQLQRPLRYLGCFTLTQLPVADEPRVLDALVPQLVVALSGRIVSLCLEERVGSKVLLTGRNATHLVDELEVHQARLGGIFLVKEPSENAEIGPIELPTYRSPIMLRHHFIVTIDVGEVFSRGIAVRHASVITGVGDLEPHLAVPVRLEIDPHFILALLRFGCALSSRLIFVLLLLELPKQVVADNHSGLNHFDSEAVPHSDLHRCVKVRLAESRPNIEEAALLRQIVQLWRKWYVVILPFHLL
jgi:hypothetical protein